MRAAWLCFIGMLAVGGCSTVPEGKPLPQTKEQRQSEIEFAYQSVKRGRFDEAEQVLAKYLYRGRNDELLFRSIGVGSDYEKKAIDTVALLLWDTQRDSTLEAFSKRYLKGYERGVMICRLAERNAVYEEAYGCWNDLGGVDRAKRVIRTESALRVLKD